MRLLIFTLLLFRPFLSLGQVQYASFQALKDSLGSCATDQLLNAYLIENDFLQEEFALNLSAYQEDSVAFTLKGMEVDLFMKNLMGDAQEEMVIQLREEKRNWMELCAVSIFHLENNQWQKVQGHISSPYLSAGYADGSFHFLFEEIATKGIFNMITSRSYTYNARTEVTEFNIITVTPQKISSLVSWSKSYSSYSGSLDRNYVSNTYHRFESNTKENPYPKQLILHAAGEGEANMRFTFEQTPQDTLSGEMYTFKNSHTYTFQFVDGQLSILNVATTHTKETTFIRPKKPTY